MTSLPGAPSAVAEGACFILLHMIHRAEVLHLDSDEIDIALGVFESATEARAACAKQEGGVLSWSQPWEGLWEAQGRERWYRVASSR